MTAKKTDLENELSLVQKTLKSIRDEVDHQITCMMARIDKLVPPPKLTNSAEDKPKSWKKRIKRWR